jgi:hypothetical protein
MMVSRRDFLKKTGQAALAVGGGLTLDALLTSCAHVPKETREDIINQEWTSNPIIPIPKKGCYIGGYRSGHFGFDNREKLKSYGEDIGKMPAFWELSLYKFGAENAHFPDWECEKLVNMGVIPEFKYGITPFPSFKEIAQGGKDDIITEFARKAKEYGKPYVFIPFKEMNIFNKDHAGEPPKWFIQTWRHMHKIFGDVGANTNTVWAINYLPYIYPSYAAHPESYYPGDDVVDWIGFTTVNRVQMGERFTHLKHIIRADYNWTRRKHPTKPLALFEMVQSVNPRQHKWIRQAYKDVKEQFPAIKMVQWWETLPMQQYEWADDQSFSRNPESIKAMREVLSDPYFIGGPLLFLEKYKTS